MSAAAAIQLRDAPPPAWAALLSKSDRGVPHSSHDNVLRALTVADEWQDVIHFDEFRQAVVLHAPPPFGDDYLDESDESDQPWRLRDWTDADTVRLCVWLARKGGLRVGPQLAMEALNVAALRERVHPVREWLHSLEWDGVARVDTWLERYAGVQASEYARFVGRWWLLSAVKRVFMPGCKADYVLILEGAQGRGKSTLLKTLTPRPEWFLDTSLEVDSKDSLLLLRGKWIIEFSELESFGRSGSSKLKAFLSRSTDEYRPPYGHHPISVRRSSIFAGTVNLDDYLQDDTGARRFWPVKCESIDLEALARDRAQLWAEAVALVLESAVSWPTAEQQREILAPEQDARYAGDAWEDRLAEFVGRATIRARASLDGITAAELLEEGLALDPAHWTPAQTQRIGRTMRRLGWVRRFRPATGSGARRHAYYPPIQVRSGFEPGLENETRGNSGS